MVSRRKFALMTLAATGAARGVLVGDVAQAQTDLGVGIIFVGASWCPACKNAAPVLAAIASSTGIPVIVASHDARPIAPFTEFVDARSHSVARQITRFPHTSIYSSVADHIVAEIIGYKNAGHYANQLRLGILKARGGFG